MTSILIGIINSAFEAKLESLRKGNSQVLEKGHTLVLGFNEHIFAIISELVIANENAKNPCIVILSEMSKEEMEDAIRARIPDTKNTRVICRSGKPTSVSALKNVSVSQCKSIILTFENDIDNIKAVLALATVLKEDNAFNAHITAIINDEENLEVIRIAGGDLVEPLYFKDAISRIMAQTCRQSGLITVYQELFDFSGDEIYLEQFPQLTGKPFKELPLYFEDCSVMGLKHNDEILINPPGETVVAEGDEVILLAADDNVAVPLSEPGKIDEKAIAAASVIRPQADRPERLLILGYNDKAPRVLAELDQYIASGSLVVLACGQPEAETAFSETTFQNFTLRLEIKDIHSRAALNKIIQEGFDYVIVMCDYNCTAEESDNQVLKLLLHLRDLAQITGQEYTLISELRDSQNQSLAASTKVNDFIIGTNLICLMMTQISENRSLSQIFNVLLSDEGSEIYIKPALDYVHPGQEIDMYTATAAALQRGHLFLGYKKLEADGQYKILVNPPKSRFVRFNREDYFIVLAEN